jgi:ribosome-associated toxin RatA of RatAB toxin-antitoxin module
LDEVKVLAQSDQPDGTRHVTSEWHGRIQKFNRKMNWTEEDIWDANAYTCRFWQIKGDFDEYRGEWAFVENGKATRLEIDMEYRFDIPLIGALMQKVVKSLIQENADNMLKALKAESERRVANS